MAKALKIAIFTSIRSEYGLLKPLIRKLSKAKDIEVQLLVGGAHLRSEFGRTVDEIKQDGFAISAEFPFLADANIEKPSLILATLQAQFAEWLQTRERPDQLVVLGDRFELLAVVPTALVSNIAVVHISGGETTEGAVDNQVRHAVAKMAHLHFPATETYKQNLMRMGEEAWRICVSGEPGLDDILSMSFTPRQALFRDLGIPESADVACVTFHPETIDNQISAAFVDAAMRRMIAQTKFFFMTTAANFDLGGKEINEVLTALARDFPERVAYRPSLGKLRYYSLLRESKLVIGNSSSGLVEVQSFNVPVLNVGKRQKGRLSNRNVLHVEADVDDIMAGVQQVMSAAFRQTYQDCTNIYGDGHACDRIVAFIEAHRERELLAKKDIFQ